MFEEIPRLFLLIRSWGRVSASARTLPHDQISIEKLIQKVSGPKKVTREDRLRFWLIPRSYSLYYIDGRRVPLVIASVQRSGSWGLKFRPVFGPNLAHWDPAFFGGFWWTPRAILGATEVRTGAALWCHDWTRYGKDMSRCHMTWQDMAWVVLHDEMRHDVVWGSHTVTGPRDPASSQV